MIKSEQLDLLVQLMERLVSARHNFDCSDAVYVNAIKEEILSLNDQPAAETSQCMEYDPSWGMKSWEMRSFIDQNGNMVEMSESSVAGKGSTLRVGAPPARMHLDRSQVEHLVTHLNKWLKETKDQ